MENDKLPPDIHNDHREWADDTGGAGFYIGVAIWLWICLLLIAAALAVF